MDILCKKSNKQRQNQGGFTLVEIIVSLGLFTVVIFIAIGSLTSVVSVNTRIQGTRAVMDNVNFSLESMVRNMRSGAVYHCGSFGDLQTPRDCHTAGETSMALRDIRGRTLVFRLNNGRIQRSENGGSSFLDMTAPEIEIETLLFYVSGSGIGNDSFQPRILVIIQGTAGEKDRERTTFNIQTTVSQRLFDS